MRLIVASSNQGKIREIRQILSLDGLEILTMRDAGFSDEIEETGATFEENAKIKADAISASFPKDLVLADDSGLMVDALGGEPGVRSARYAGEGAGNDKKIQKLLDALNCVSSDKRGARFVCTMVLKGPGEYAVRTGECQGRIGFSPAGNFGFGYDPIFLVAEKDYKLTMAQMPESEKNTISHRKRALDGIREELKKYLSGKRVK